jgi:hypothetical protein
MAAGDVVSIACNQVIRSSINDGTCSGGVVITDGAMVFDGVDDYVDSIPSSSMPKDFLTISLWVKSTKANTQQYLFSERGNAGNRGVQIRINDTNLPFFAILNSSNTNRDTTGTTAIGGTNIWFNFIGTYDGDKSRLYINTILEATSTSLTGPLKTTTLNLDIGADGVGTIPFEGEMNNVLVFNRVLTQSEITQIYEAGKDAYSPVTSGLVAQYSGRDYYGTAGAPTTILDTASNNNSTALFVERALKTQRVNANSKYIVEALDGKAILVNSIEEAA